MIIYNENTNIIEVIENLEISKIIRIFICIAILLISKLYLYIIVNDCKQDYIIILFAIIPYIYFIYLYIIVYNQYKRINKLIHIYTINLNK